MVESGSGAATAKREWWRKKRWWLPPALFVWLFARWTIPWSLEGPALSCWEAANERVLAERVLAVARESDGDFDKTVRYILRSGLTLRSVILEDEIKLYAKRDSVNINFRDGYEQRIAFSNYTLSSDCFPIWLIADAYPSKVSIKLLKVFGNNTKIVMVNGEAVDGGNQD